MEQSIHYLIRSAFLALLFTACSGKGTAGTEKSQNTKTESGSESADDSNSKLNDLYQQENQIFADHEDVWNKAFGMMSKSAADPNGNYADYLADTIESNKESFTDDELKTLTADIEAILTYVLICKCHEFLNKPPYNKLDYDKFIYITYSFTRKSRS